jgi:hypothetical protein
VIGASPLLPRSVRLIGEPVLRYGIECPSIKAQYSIPLFAVLLLSASMGWPACFAENRGLYAGRALLSGQAAVQFDDTQAGNRWPNKEHESRVIAYSSAIISVRDGQWRALTFASRRIS